MKSLIGVHQHRRGLLPNAELTSGIKEHEEVVGGEVALLMARIVVGMTHSGNLGSK